MLQGKVLAEEPPLFLALLPFAVPYVKQHRDTVLGFSKAGGDRGGAKRAFLCFIFWF